MIDPAGMKDAKWYSGTFPGCIGIVLYDTGFGFKAYIGPGGGFDEEVDKFHICSVGARFHQAKAIWPGIEEWAD